MWKYLSVVLLAVVVTLGPRQPCPPEYAAMITKGCGYDRSKAVLCTDRGCFQTPKILTRGRAISTLTGKQYPAYVVVEHRIGWLHSTTFNTSTSREVLCLMAHLGQSTQPRL